MQVIKSFLLTIKACNFFKLFHLYMPAGIESDLHRTKEKPAVIRAV